MSYHDVNIRQDLAFYKDSTNDSIYIPYIKFVCGVGIGSYNYYDNQQRWWNKVSIYFYIHW